MRICKKIFVALDNPDFNHCFAFANNIKEDIAGVKLGLEFFTANGPEAIKKFTQANIPVFLDLKFHDIPNTVRHAVREACKLGVKMLTIHASGGEEMMRLAAKEAYDYSQQYGTTKPLIVAVTILTSMSQDELTSLGVNKTLPSQVLNLARLAKKANLDGIVCSPHEVRLIKENIGKEFITVTPGIRFAHEIASNNTQDQKRVLDPKQAVALGSDFLVMGRSITSSKNPKEVLKQI